MADRTETTKSTEFNVGWWILLLVSGLSVVNHAVLIFAIPAEAVLFLGWAGFNVFSTVIIWVPYRRLERWAWSLTWILFVPYAVIFLFDSAIGPLYGIAAGLVALGQGLAYRSFYPASEAREKVTASS